MHSDELSERAITSLKGIGPARAEQFARMGLFSLRDLLGFMPRGYLDFSRERCISDIEDGEAAAVHVEFIGPARTIRAKNGTVVTNVSIGDSSENMTAVWFNQSFMQRNIPREPGGYILGFMDKKHGARFVRAVFSETLPGVLPVYPLVRGLTQSVVRNAVRAALDACGTGMMQETLPRSVLSEFNLISLKHAIHSVHFPHDAEELRQARRRLAFEDALMLTIVLQMLRQERGRERGIAFETGGVRNEFIEMLPFELTHAQCSVMDELEHDMSAPRAMNRLIQGDVGSGKTVLAMYAMYIAMKNGRQSVLMVPTEILAEQHYVQLQRYFGEKCALLTGKTTQKERIRILNGIKNGEIIAITGTHALIQSNVEFNNVGLVVTDEQHRFGVHQRALLNKKAESPDVLIMSATPIPRTLSLILYGDLEISVVNGMPLGRKPILTRLVPLQKRVSMYRYIENCVKESGIQAYVVCPLVDEQDEQNESELSFCRVPSAKGVFRELSQNLSIPVGLLHGKMNGKLKTSVMESFRTGEIKLLVSTTVIEVGVDVPNACIMVIESADRFGLAQLHQLRGRVGRGERESFCFLLPSAESKSANARLKLMVQTNDGFEIAEKDLETRGPGELMGMRQHGVSEFAAAALAADLSTLTAAKDCAQRLLTNPSMDDCGIVNRAMNRFRAVRDQISIN